jgi:lipopolysaccharide export system permease protein
MGSIGRYIFRTTLGAFVVVLVGITTLMWITQALRSIDLITRQGQNIFVFIGITSLIIPMLVMIIAPIALMIAIAHVLNKLSNDSELIVINASGMAPWQVFRPFMAIGILVSFMVAGLSFYVTPKCLQELRRWATAVRAEIVTNNIQPGQFVVVDGQLTVHIRERLANGQLLGILLDDQRDRKERTTIIAQRGEIVTEDNSIFLLLENGTVQRHEAGKPDPAIVQFKKYAFDLSRLAPTTTVTFSVHERFVADLYSPKADDPVFARQPGRFRAELHNRFALPLYPIVFTIVTFAYLGAPRTTRQSRAMSLVTAIGVVSLLRGVGFFGAVSGANSTIAIFAPYFVLAAGFILGLWGIARGVIIEPPAFVGNAVNAIVEGFTRRSAAASGAHAR